VQSKRGPLHIEFRRLSIFVWEDPCYFVAWSFGSEGLRNHLHPQSARVVLGVAGQPRGPRNEAILRERVSRFLISHSQITRTFHPASHNCLLTLASRD
jgi:hypothetical protein